MCADSGRFDDFFMTIAKETGGLEGLLGSLFSFLYRRTDFYYENEPGDKMGFPPGVNEKIVNQLPSNTALISHSIQANECV